MDYKAIYYKIIEKAKKETENGNRHVGYYERHHIQPKSLGGTNDKENLVKLTAREHFICHWLLVKMYNKGTTERNKMLCALWRMQSINENHKRYINSHVYEKLRIEFAEAMSKLTSINQSGNRNSQFGKKWYTNRDTGESKSFFEKPDERWIEGRGLFNGQTSSIKMKLKKLNKPYKNTKRIKVHQQNGKDAEITIVRKNYLDNIHNEGIENAKKLWNQYHSGDYKKLEDFANEIEISKIALYKKFKKYIPIFSKHEEQKRSHFLPDKKLINVFE